MEILEGVGGAADPTGGGAGQHESPYPLRVAEGELLGDHAAERDPHDRAVLPAETVEQRGRVVGEILHGVGPRRHAALTEPALVVGQDVEVLGQGSLGEVRRLAQVATGARDDQQRPPRSGALVVEGDPVGVAIGHGLHSID